METRVAFIAHPVKASDVGNFFRADAQKKGGFLGLSCNFIGEIAAKNFKGAEIKDSYFRKRGTEICERGPLPGDICVIETNKGTFVESVYTMPFTTEQIVNPKNHDLIREWGIRLLEMAKENGACISGLGACIKNKRVTDSGKYFIGKVDGMYISNGNNNTAQVCAEAGIAAAQKIGLDLENLVIAIVGANGSVGGVCAEMATADAAKLILVGSKREGSQKRLEKRADLANKIAKERYKKTMEIETYTDLASGLKEADLIYSATDSLRPIIFPDMVKRGSVIVDIARPHDTGKGDRFIEKGVLAMDGGLQYHNNGRIHFSSMGLEPGYFLACGAEPLILAMAGAARRDFIETNIDDALLLREYSRMLGFKVDKDRFRHHYRPIPEEAIMEIRAKAR